MTVYLVGAGPGDPGLLTARALELIARADVIVYDRLIPSSALSGARADAQLVYAGKEGGGPSMPQEEIDRLLVDHGRAGQSVVRLKGGDPFVFGRGGEEAEALRKAGIAFEVVPGVTAGVAAPAYAGIPVTHRESASAVAFVTGHEDPTKPDSALDWNALAAFPGTLVVYMGVRQLGAIAQQLIAGGRARMSRPRCRARHAARPAGRDRDASTIASVAERAHQRSGDRDLRPGHGSARAPGVVRGGRCRSHRRRHTRPRAGERPRFTAAGPGSGRRRGARDQDRAAGGLAARPAEL